MESEDPTILIADEFKRLLDQFEQQFKDLPVKVCCRRHELDGYLRGLLKERGTCKFLAYIDAIDDCQVMEPNQITVPYFIKHNFTQFVADVNACIKVFNDKILNRECLFYHHKCGIWIKGIIDDIILKDMDCAYRIRNSTHFIDDLELIEPNDVRIHLTQCKCGNLVPMDYLNMHIAQAHCECIKRTVDRCKN